MLKRSLSAVVLVALLTVMVSFPAWAVPGLINYQGKLTDSGGNALNGTFSMTFRLYNASSGGSSLWNETQSVQVIDGIYSIELGSVSPLLADLFDSDALYLEVVIGSETLSPRQRLTSTAYSMKAGDAETVAGLTPSEIAATGHSHDGSDITTGAVVEARIDPVIARDSEITWGNLANIPSGFADGVDDTGGITTETDPTVLASVKDGVSWSELSSIPSGFADGVDNVGGGITGVKAGDGLTGGGSSGDVTVNVGAGTGIDVSSNAVSVEVPLSLSGSIVSGAIISATNSSSGYGVYGYSNGGYGVRGHSNGHTGVHGEHDTSGNYGWLGSSYMGVYGSGYGSGSYGVYGVSAKYYGVYGKHYSSGNYGYLGSSAYGVVGYHTGGYGAGVYGGSSSGNAGHFNGPVRVTGYLTKLGGGFQIDHPLDPDNKYLNHSFVESPEMKNIYDGVVVLDANGERWVELPEWFEALNKDFRYQLTCIGGFAQVYIAQEISDNRFKIAGGNPGMKVSWQVTGIRQDSWAEANRIPVEEDKAAEEQGLYLSPESYGQPKEKGIEWVRNSEMMQQMEEEKEIPVESQEPVEG